MSLFLNFREPTDYVNIYAGQPAQSVLLSQEQYTQPSQPSLPYLYQVQYQFQDEKQDEKQDNKQDYNHYHKHDHNHNHDHSEGVTVEVENAEDQDQQTEDSPEDVAKRFKDDRFGLMICFIIDYIMLFFFENWIFQCVGFACLTLGLFFFCTLQRWWLYIVIHVSLTNFLVLYISLCKYRFRLI